MRVTLDSSIRRLGGVSRHLFELACGLESEGLEVFLSLPRDAPDVRAAARERGLRVGDPGRAEIVHFHLADTFDREATVRMLRSRPRARIVVTEHLPHCNGSDPALPYGGTSALKHRLKTILKRSQLGLVDRTILPSTGCLAFVSRRYRLGGRGLRLVPHGIPEPKQPFRSSWGGDRVTAVGSLEVQKGFDVLTRAAALGSGWKVDVYGEGPSRPALEQLAAAHGAPVRFGGWADRAEMAIETASVMCVPSRWEAFSYVALEAMWAGAPVVASRVDGLSDLVAHGETGLLVEPDDEVALAQAISTLVANPAYAERLGRGARRRASEHFSYRAMVEGVIRVYREVLPR